MEHGRATIFSFFKPVANLRECWEHVEYIGIKQFRINSSTTQSRRRSPDQGYTYNVHRTQPFKAPNKFEDM